LTFAENHDNELGKAPSHKLFEAVTVKRKDGVESPRSFADYEVTINRAAIPAGIEVIERI
jgi:CRISPR-associated protein Csd2